MSGMELNAEHVSILGKRPDQHKYDHGHLLVLSGPRYQTGAARLAARAALRVGAGLVTLGATERTMPELAGHLTEIMLAQIETGAALSTKLKQDARINALCIGPALRVDRHGADLLHHTIESERPCVIDADALTLISQDQALKRSLHANCVLTPHEGEFARLFPDIDTGRSAKARKTAVEEAAKLTGATVLLKGAITVIGSADGATSIINNSKTNTAPWLATAGAGDVLAGLIAGLLARWTGPKEATETGALLHVAAARAFGPGLVAGDLPDLVPQVLGDLGV